MAKKATATKKEVEIIINPYELMLILSPDLRESEVKKKLKEITDMIEKAGGKITNEDFWGKRDLAYRLKKHLEGIYMVYNLELPNNFLNELKDHFRIEKDILRSLILKLPADYTYTKYDIEVEEEPKKREPAKKKVTVKKVEPVVPVKEEEVPEEEKPEEAPIEEEVAPVEEEVPAEPEAIVEEKKPEKEAEPEVPIEEIKEKEAALPTEEEEKEIKPEAPPEEPEEAAPKLEEEEEKPKKEVKKKEKKEPPTKEETVPPTEEEEEEKKKEYESELDRKLDELLGGEDLNL